VVAFVALLDTGGLVVRVVAEVRGRALRIAEVAVVYRSHVFLGVRRDKHEQGDHHRCEYHHKSAHVHILLLAELGLTQK
jgi:hypothetical protein